MPAPSRPVVTVRFARTHSGVPVGPSPARLVGPLDVVGAAVAPVGPVGPAGPDVDVGPDDERGAVAVDEPEQPVNTTAVNAAAHTVGRTLRTILSPMVSRGPSLPSHRTRMRG
jgi:hypothetical protein